jgi:predicted enzyme related to lactoylglutathione lyase
MTALAYTIVFVSDMTRSGASYRDIVGLPLKHQSSGWSEFGKGGCVLALRKSDRKAQGEIDNIPVGSCHPGFLVADIDAFAAKMNQAGVAVIQPIKMQRFGGRMGIWRDPRWIASVCIRDTVDPD